MNWHQLVDDNVRVSDKERDKLITIVYNEWKRRHGISMQKENKLLRDILRIIKDRREEIDYTRYTHHKIYKKLCDSLGFHYEHVDVNTRILPAYSDENDSQSYYYSYNGYRLSTCSAQVIFFCKPKAWNWEFSRFEMDSMSVSEEELWLKAGVI